MCISLRKFLFIDGFLAFEFINSFLGIMQSAGLENYAELCGNYAELCIIYAGILNRILQKDLEKFDFEKFCMRTSLRRFLPTYIEFFFPVL
jgi:hypothetical protein